MAKLVPGINDLATLFPDVAAQADGWDPASVTSRSGKILGWKCEKGHTWAAVVSNRTPPQSSGCPYCSGNKVLAGFNDLATLHPELAKEAVGWDPSTVGTGSKRNLLWRCERGHTWTAQVNNRTPPQRTGCPCCSGRQAWAGFNDLASQNPKVAAQADGWDPSTLTIGSDKVMRWRCELGHTWNASVNSRTPPHSQGCPFCSGKRVLAGFNDLATKHPEVAAQADGWDPSTITSKSARKVLWRCELGHPYHARVADRTPPQSTGCPFCSGKAVLVGFNDLASLCQEIAVEVEGWDATTVTVNSGKRLPWRCKRGHVWTAEVNSRTPPKNHGCPYCSGNKVLHGFNDLATIFPEIAKEACGWDPTEIMPKSEKKLKWHCKAGHVYSARVSDRTPPKNSGCSFCSGMQALSGFNDLATLYPEVAATAHGWNPETLTAKSQKKMKWLCERGHVYTKRVADRTPPHSQGCPYCSGRRVLEGFNDLATLYPALAKEADGWNPSTVTAGSERKLRWRCEKGHIWPAQVVNRTANGSGCPECAESGFKASLPAWFYLLERPGEQQLGITNYMEDRLFTHSRNGWVEVEVVGPFPGDQVLATEKKFKQWLRKEVGLVPSTHENWFTDRMEVQSLAELKARSGIETDVF